MSASVIDILIATNNPGKAREIAAVLAAPEGMAALGAIRWHTLADVGRAIPEPVEDGATFEENSRLKAEYYAQASGMMALADDSGLEVDALDKAPGVWSARYATLPGEPTRAERDAANNLKLVAALRGVSAAQRTARFRCVVTIAGLHRLTGEGESPVIQAAGAIEGCIIDSPRGAGGFGYDPYFLVPSLGKTTAELSPEHKNSISHRGQAARQIVPILQRLLNS